MLTRAIVAILGVLGLYGVWHFFQVPGLITVCSIVTLIGTMEFSLMVEKSNRLVQTVFVLFTFAFFLTFTFYSQSFLVFICFFSLLVAYFILFSRLSIEKRITMLASWLVGFLYCGALTGTTVLGIAQYGGEFFTALLTLSFLTDTFAYLGGRALGRTPLAPAISPKKTREGGFIGLMGGSLVGFWYLSTLNHSSPTLLLLATCLLASLFTQVGDLFESMIKRYSGVKDSGKILPGHGGVLDRIDGLLFASPVVYLWMQTYL